PEQLLTSHRPPAAHCHCDTFWAPACLVEHSRSMLATSSGTPLQSSSSALHVSGMLPGTISGTQLNAAGDPLHSVLPTAHTPGKPVVQGWSSSSLESSVVPLQSLSTPSQLSA